MRKQGQDVVQVNLAGIRRDIINLAHNYSIAQKAVRKATSNDHWGPSSTLMAEIADLTYNVVAFTEIMQMLWKRLNDHGKNWRHVYKALVLLEYLIKTGTEKVAQQCKENIFAIQTLKDFQYMEGSKDQGVNVRERAKQLVALLKDEERLRNERARALKAKERLARTVSGFGSDGLDASSNTTGTNANTNTAGNTTTGTGTTTSTTTSTSSVATTITGGTTITTTTTTATNNSGGTTNAVSPVSNSDFQDWEPCRVTAESTSTSSRRASKSAELEAARPQTVGEEELQLQLALAMSREEAEQEEQRRRSDDVRLQLALSQSQQDFKTPQQSHVLDLLDVNLGEEASGSSTVQADPWGVPITGPLPVVRPPPQAQNDPWSSSSSSTTTTAAAAAAAAATSPIMDPWTPVLPRRPSGAAASVDPWRPTSPLGPPATADPWSPVTTAESETRRQVATASREGQRDSASPGGNNPPPTISSGRTLECFIPLGSGGGPPLAPSLSVPLSATTNGTSGNRFLGRAGNHQPTSPAPISTPDLDEFDVISNRKKHGSSSPQQQQQQQQQQQPLDNNDGSGSPSCGGTLSPDPFDLGTIGDNLPANAPGTVKKTPQSFLGENSCLVNLDNLVSNSTLKSATPPAPPATMSYSANPFATATPPPRPTINQIRQDPWAANATTTANPFLS